MPAKKKKGKSKAKAEEEELIRQQHVDGVRARFESLYDVYDPDDAGSINDEDFADFVRSLGLYPTNERLNELAHQCKDDETLTFFTTAKLEEVLIPLVIDAILNPTSDMAPPAEDEVMMALRSLDLEHKGHLTEGDFRTLLTNHGERLDPDELERAVEEAVNPATGVVDLDRYAGRLLYNSKLF